VPGAIQYRADKAYVAPYPVDPTDLTSGVAIIGAQLVEASVNSGFTTGVRIARAASNVCVGVALQDAGQFGVPGAQSAFLPPANEPVNASYPPILGGTGGINDNVYADFSGLLGNVSVLLNGEVFVYYTANTAFGTPLAVTAASGSGSALLNLGGCVAGYASTDPKVIVGKCTNPGGVVASASAPVLGRAFIRV
jgi:hypothetical protein